MSFTVETIEPRAFASVVAEELAFSVKEAVDEKGVCRVALAGGRTPGKVYRSLSIPPLSATLPWEKLQLFLGDERWVPLTDNQSNAHMVHETLLHHVTLNESQVHFVDTSLASPAEGASDYENQIQQSFGVSGEELPVFDIVLLGIGEDGHTASIFPGQSDLWNTGGIARATVNPEGVDRITLTPEVLLNADKIFFLVTGDSKADIVTQVLKQEKDVVDFPAQLYRRAPEKVTWFIDSAAGVGLVGEE